MWAVSRPEHQTASGDTAKTVSRQLLHPSVHKIRLHGQHIFSLIDILIKLFLHVQSVYAL